MTFDIIVAGPRSACFLHIKKRGNLQGIWTVASHWCMCTRHKACSIAKALCGFTEVQSSHRAHSAAQYNAAPHTTCACAHNTMPNAPRSSSPSHDLHFYCARLFRTQKKELVATLLHGMLPRDQGSLQLAMVDSMLPRPLLLVMPLLPLLPPLLLLHAHKHSPGCIKPRILSATICPNMSYPYGVR